MMTADEGCGPQLIRKPSSRFAASNCRTQKTGGRYLDCRKDYTRPRHGNLQTILRNVNCVSAGSVIVST